MVSGSVVGFAEVSWEAEARLELSAANKRLCWWGERMKLGCAVRRAAVSIGILVLSYNLASYGETIYLRVPCPAVDVVLLRRGRGWREEKYLRQPGASQTAHSGTAMESDVRECDRLGGVGVGVRVGVGVTREVKVMLDALTPWKRGVKTRVDGEGKREMRPYSESAA